MTAPAPDAFRARLMRRALDEHMRLTLHQVDQLAVEAARVAADLLAAAATTTRSNQRPYYPRRYGSPLTVREVDVVAGVARGDTNEEIGATLGLSPLTVRSHLRRIGARLGCGERAGIVGIAYRRGWLAHLEPEPRQPVTLRPRRMDVLRGMAYGLSTEEIARRLSLSEDTVKSHSRVLFADLQARNRAHAVALGYQHGHLVVPRPAAEAS